MQELEKGNSEAKRYACHFQKIRNFLTAMHDVNEENAFNKHLEAYRNGDYSFSMADVVDKPKGHQYTPQHYAFAGLVDLWQSPDWLMRKNDKHSALKDEVLSNGFIDTLLEEAKKRG